MFQNKETEQQTWRPISFEWLKLIENILLVRIIIIATPRPPISHGRLRRINILDHRSNFMRVQHSIVQIPKLQEKQPLVKAYSYGKIGKSLVFCQTTIQPRGSALLSDKKMTPIFRCASIPCTDDRMWLNEIGGYQFRCLTVLPPPLLYSICWEWFVWSPLSRWSIWSVTSGHPVPSGHHGHWSVCSVHSGLVVIPNRIQICIISVLSSASLDGFSVLFN